MSYSVLPLDWFQQPTVELAKNLLGTSLIHQSKEGETAGLIVESEAYLYPDDPAAHSRHGQTQRNAPMFGPAAHAYVYFTYGMHTCFNVVAPSEGEGVLIRALEPVAGVELMQQRRTKTRLRDLCSGPAKLTQAMGITLNMSGKPLQHGNLRIAEGTEIPPTTIAAGPRIGISQAKGGNEFVSR